MELFYRWNFLKRPWKQSNHPSWYFRVVLKLKINKKGSMQMYNGNAWRPQTGDRPWSWKSWRLRGFKEGNEDEISITEGRIQSLTAGLLFLPFLPKHSSHSRASNNSDSRLIYPEYKTKKINPKTKQLWRPAWSGTLPHSDLIALSSSYSVQTDLWNICLIINSPPKGRMVWFCSVNLTIQQLKLLLQLNNRD